MAGAITGTHVKCRWINGMQEFYDAATFETVHVNAPYYFYDDFTGLVGQVTAADPSITWTPIDVAAIGTATPHILPGTAASGATGVVEIMMDVAQNEIQDSGIYWNDQTCVSVLNDTVFECRLAMHTIPGAATEAVWGMAGHYNADPDTVAESAWFRLQGSAVLVVESQDTTNNEDDVATGITLAADEYHIFRIDFGNLADVRFYVDGTRVAPTQLFDMSNLTAIEAMFQPYFVIDHAAVAQAGSLYIDTCRIWGARSTRVLI